MEDGDEDGKGRRPGRMLGVAAFVLLLVGAVAGGGAFVAGRVLFTGAEIRSQHMQPTYQPGDRVGFRRGVEVRREDVILFRAAAWGEDFNVVERVVAVAFFVPALVYLADAIGTQSEAIAVRGLSLTRAGIRHLLAGELRTGMLIGVALGVIAFPLIVLAFGDARLAAAVSTSIFIAGSVAAGIGIGLPWLLARRGLDPAYGSGPVATVVQDILTILVYFAVLQAFGI